MKISIYFFLISSFIFYNCTDSSDNNKNKAVQTLADYFDYSGRDDKLSGGVKMIPITTPKGNFKVWTKRIGNNPTIKVLILHGGPGFSHE